LDAPFFTPLAIDGFRFFFRLAFKNSGASKTHPMALEYRERPHLASTAPRADL